MQRIGTVSKPDGELALDIVVYVTIVLVGLALSVQRNQKKIEANQNPARTLMTSPLTFLVYT